MRCDEMNSRKGTAKESAKWCSRRHRARLSQERRKAGKRHPSMRHASHICMRWAAGG